MPIWLQSYYFFTNFAKKIDKNYEISFIFCNFVGENVKNAVY